jgi:hypothetical protein
MTPETWTVMIVAAMFFLLGVAGSPIAWAAALRRGSQREQAMDGRLREMTLRLDTLGEQIMQVESIAKEQSTKASPSSLPARRAVRGPHRPLSATAHRAVGEAVHNDGREVPTLIAVPSLAAPPSERDASVRETSERYAAIWSLADAGSPVDVIARATGQPVGQIELILGLRRQIDTTRTVIPHGSGS